MLFSLLFIKYLHYTKYLIDVQHFFHQLLHYRLRYCDLPVQIQGPASAVLCQNRQASAHRHVSCTRRCPGDAGPFVRTDKQAPTVQGLQAYCYITNSGIAVCCCDLDAQGRRPFVRTDKQAVIHRLSTVCGWLSTGYGRIKKRLTGFLRALVHVSSSAAQEPWSPVHMGSVFSPWTTNDST